MSFYLVNNYLTYSDTWKGRDYRKTTFELHDGEWICAENRVDVKQEKHYTLPERPSKMIIILYPPSDEEITAMICAFPKEGDQQDEKQLAEQEAAYEATNDCFY